MAKGKLRKLKDFWGMITIKLALSGIKSTILRYASFVIGCEVACDGKMSRHNSKMRSCMKEVLLLIFITAMVFKQSSQVLQYLLFFYFFAQFILCRQQNAFCMNPWWQCHMYNKRNQVCDIKIIRSLSFVSHADAEFNETEVSWWWLLSLETLHHAVINLDV